MPDSPVPAGEYSGTTIADRICGPAMDPELRPSADHAVRVQLDARRALAVAETHLVSLMEECGHAMYDDSEFNCPVYRDGKVAGCNGVNSSEASEALDAVAAIFGIDGPTVVYDRLCEADDAD